MNKIYRMVHADGFSFKIFGINYGVRTNQTSARGSIKSHLPPGSTLTRTQTVEHLYSFVIQNRESRPGVRHFHLLYCNSEILARTQSFADLLEAFESDLNLRIATTTSTRFVVHAGVVAWEGKAIVIPGRSYTGKTTLVKEFLRYGATYYSDEFAVFDSRGYVHPFTKTLAIRDDRTQEQRRIPAEQFGSPIGVKPLRAGLVLFTHYSEAAKWRPRNISRGRGALRLLQNSFSIREKPEEALAFAEAALRNATILAGIRGEAQEVVRGVLCGCSYEPRIKVTTQIIQPQREGYGRRPEHQAETM